MTGDQDLQQLLDAMGHVPALRGLLAKGLENLVGRLQVYPGDRFKFPLLRPLPVRATSLNSFEPIEEDVIEVVMPFYRGSDRQPTVADIRQLRGRLDQVHEDVFLEVLRGADLRSIGSGYAAGQLAHALGYRDEPVTTQASNWPAPNQLTLKSLRDAGAQFDRAYRSVMGASPLTDLLVEARRQRELMMAMGAGSGMPRAFMDPPAGHAGSGYAINNWPSSTQPWPPDRRFETGLCPLCGARLDPDEDDRRVPLQLPHLTGPVQACSRACATAFAMAMEPLASKPRSQEALRLEARHVEREQAAAAAAAWRRGARGGVTDSTPSAQIAGFGDEDNPLPFDLLTLRVVRHNPWTA